MILGMQYYFLLKQGHGFDMMGLGEHVHGLKFFDGKAGLNELTQVPAQGRWVAGDIDQPFSGEGCKVGGESRGALSGRVDDDTVKTLAFCGQSPATCMNGAFLKQGIGEACLFAVFSGTANGRPLTFNSQ